MVLSSDMTLAAPKRPALSKPAEARPRPTEIPASQTISEATSAKDSPSMKTPAITFASRVAWAMIRTAWRNPRPTVTIR